VRLDPDYTRAYKNLGIILATQGRLEEAIEQFSAALKIKPGDAKARQKLEESLKKISN
jgi:tetratricopeptide (TPR) repeat protein